MHIVKNKNFSFFKDDKKKNRLFKIDKKVFNFVKNKKKN